MALVRVDVDVDGLTETLALLADTEAALRPPRVTDAALAAARVFRDGARRRAPRRSGRLARSIEAHPVGGGSAVARTDLVYAQITEFGGGRGPVHARVLAFDPGGGVVFRPHTRTPAQPYWLPTFVNDADLALNAFADTIVAGSTGA